MSRYMRFVMVASLAGGFLLGLLSVTPSKADTYSYTVWNYPGSPTSTLYCGWHVICLGQNPNDGNGLDWGSPSGSAIYWRSNSSNTQGRYAVGSILVVDMSSGSCNTVWAELRSPVGTSLQSVKYLHTAPYGAGSSYQVDSGTWPVSSESRVGTTVSSDCGGLYPAHLHQEYMAYWTRNSVYPTRATCDDDYGCVTYQSVWTHYQQERIWYSSGY